MLVFNYILSQYIVFFELIPGKFNIPNIECILVLDKGKALAGAGEMSHIIRNATIRLMKSVFRFWITTWSICTATKGTCGDCLEQSRKEFDQDQIFQFISPTSNP